MIRSRFGLYLFSTISTISSIWVTFPRSSRRLSFLCSSSSGQSNATLPSSILMVPRIPQIGQMTSVVPGTTWIRFWWQNGQEPSCSPLHLWSPVSIASATFSPSLCAFASHSSSIAAANLSATPYTFNVSTISVCAEKVVVKRFGTFKLVQCSVPAPPTPISPPGRALNLPFAHSGAGLFPVRTIPTSIFGPKTLSRNANSKLFGDRLYAGAATIYPSLSKNFSISQIASSFPYGHFVGSFDAGHCPCTQLLQL